MKSTRCALSNSIFDDPVEEIKCGFGFSVPAFLKFKILGLWQEFDTEFAPPSVRILISFIYHVNIQWLRDTT